MNSNDFPRLLTKFLGDYLPSQRNLSVNTVKSYRDSFILLLRYCRSERNIILDQLTVTQINVDLITAFLSHLETKRHCSAATRNQRLAAIHAFFRFLQTEEPEHMLQGQRVLAVPLKRHERPEVGYLSANELKVILAQPDLSTSEGRRDAVLLSLLYDTGARVQELIDLSFCDIRLEAPAQIRLIGKGYKVRSVPLMAHTVRLLKQYYEEQEVKPQIDNNKPVFCNRKRERLSRSGIRYILKKYADRARLTCPTLRKDIFPHMLRHTKAMHLLQAGNPLVVIRNILGHTDVKTTEIYARADMEMKSRALSTIADNVPSPDLPSWKKNSDLLEWLRSL